MGCVGALQGNVFLNVVRVQHKRARVSEPDGKVEHREQDRDQVKPVLDAREVVPDILPVDHVHDFSITQVSLHQYTGCRGDINDGIMVAAENHLKHEHGNEAERVLIEEEPLALLHLTKLVGNQVSNDVQVFHLQSRLQADTKDLMCEGNKCPALKFSVVC